MCRTPAEFVRVPLTALLPASAPLTQIFTVAPSHVAARGAHVLSGSVAVPSAFCSPPMLTCPSGCAGVPLFAYIEYTIPAGFSLNTTVRHPVPSAVGYTHASSVEAVLRSRLLLSATVTQLVATPAKDSAPPNLPVVHVAPASVPVFPLPDVSARAVPLPSSKAHAPTRPFAT